jgi:hypothetical protein
MEVIMNRLEKGASERKMVRIPAGLRQKLEEVVYKSRTVLAECPFGHDVKVHVTVEYVPKGGPDLDLSVRVYRKKTKPGPHLVQSDESVLDEHFEVLLDAPLRERERQFVRFFQDRDNEPTSPLQWMRKGFSEKVHVRAINSLCMRHRLGLSFADTGDFDIAEGISVDRLAKYKFYVMERARKARE